MQVPQTVLATSENPSDGCYKEMKLSPNFFVTNSHPNLLHILMPFIILHPVTSVWTTWKFHLCPESESYWKRYSLYVSPWLWCFPITHRHKTRIIFMFLFKTKSKVAWRKSHYHSAGTGLTLQPLQKKKWQHQPLFYYCYSPHQSKQITHFLYLSRCLPPTYTLSILISSLAALPASTASLEYVALI